MIIKHIVNWYTYKETLSRHLYINSYLIIATALLYKNERMEVDYHSRYASFKNIEIIKHSNNILKN